MYFAYKDEEMPQKMGDKQLLCSWTLEVSCHMLRSLVPVTHASNKMSVGSLKIQQMPWTTEGDMVSVQALEHLQQLLEFFSQNHVFRAILHIFGA
jgi:hypothetical protein